MQLIILYLLCQIIYSIDSSIIHYNLENSRTEIPTCGKLRYFTTRSSYWHENKEMFIKMKDLPQPSCIAPASDSEGRIIRGQKAFWNREFPWIAEIRVKYNNTKSIHSCGGAILTEYFVLTAEHCVKRFKEKNILIRIGEYDQNTDSETEEDFEVEKIMHHTDYGKASEHDSDIAVLRLKPKNGQGIKFNEDAQPVCLPTSALELSEYLTAKLAGWGRTEVEHLGARFLQTMEVPILTDDKCKKAWSKWYTSGMFCAANLEAGINTCKGDSGGPLVARINGRATVIGIVSFGHLFCGHPGYPGVYTKVTKYIPWILDQMKNACD